MNKKLIKKTLSSEHKKKISESLKGYIKSEEHRRKLSEALMGIKRSEETKRKMSMAIRSKLRPKFGKDNSHWNGGQFKHPRGYVFVYRPKHPYKTNKRYVRRSRLIMEKKLGRYLKREEVIHHINGIRDDDRPENLQLFASNGEHISFHRKKGGASGYINNSKDCFPNVVIFGEAS